MLQARKTLKYVNEKRLVDLGARVSRRQSRCVRRASARRADVLTILLNDLAATTSDQACRVRLDVFDGPLDLLLSLIKERQLDVATVPLAAVAEQYLAYVRAMEELDVEVAAEYLVIAATLVFLKSRRCCRRFRKSSRATKRRDARGGRGAAAPPADRILEVSRIGRAAARPLSSKRVGYFYREAGDPASEFVQRYRIDPEKLKHAFVAMLAQARPEKRSIVRERVSLIASMDYIVRRLKENGEVMFSSSATSWV